VPSLDGPRAKINRAEHKLDALSGEIRPFMERNLYTPTVEANEIDQSYSVFLEETTEIPVEEWGLALGDILHNARGALDHLVAQLVMLTGRAPHNRHQFPILKDDTDWKRKVVNPPKNRKRGMLDFIDGKHVAAIKRLQPYQPSTGKPSLFVLQRFSNADKHRLIHVSATWVTQTPKITMKLAFPLTIDNVIHDPPGTPLGKRTEIARVYPRLTIYPDSPDREMQVSAEVKLTTVFGDEPGKEDTRVREFRACIKDARAIIESFAAAFP
jgi:hypothetical protein